MKFATEVTFTRKVNCLTLKLNNGRQPRPSSTGTFSLRRQSSGPMVSTFSADKLDLASGTRVTGSIDLEIEHGLKLENSKRPDLAMESLQLKKVFTFSAVTGKGPESSLKTVLTNATILDQNLKHRTHHGDPGHHARPERVLPARSERLVVVYQPKRSARIERALQLSRNFHCVPRHV